MADGVPVTSGSGTTIATDDVAGIHYQRIKLTDGTADSTTAAIVDSFGNLRTVGGQSSLATYGVSVNAQANTAAAQSIVIESYASAIVRIQKVIIWQPGMFTGAAVRVLQLIRTTTAGTGGAVTPAAFGTDVTGASVDGAYAGICRAKPTAGTETTVIMEIPVYTPAAVAAFTPIVIDFAQGDPTKAPSIPSGTANGIALKDPGAAGGAGFAAQIIFTVGV